MRLPGDMQVEAQRPPFRARGPGAGNKAAATAGTCLVGAGGGKGADTSAALKKPGREGALGSGAAGGNRGRSTSPPPGSGLALITATALP